MREAQADELGHVAGQVAHPLDRAAHSQPGDHDAQVAEEDYAATACAIENLMLAARGRGLASFWRTPGVLSRPAVAKILNVPRKVRLIGVVHLGWPGEPFPEQPERSAAEFTRWLD